jgi:2-polyprenyl-3-methyl-5-hydroxy-6-metoxy-1,4-benzoquinol methylase
MHLLNKEEYMSLAINEDEQNYIKVHWNRWSYITKLIQEIPKCFEILDMGLGGGVLSIILRKLGYSVYGVDIKRKESPEWIERLKRYGINFKICDITKQKLPFSDNSFDLVIFLEVLEHLITSHPPYHVFDEINRVMRPGAHLILSTLNAVALHKRMLVLLGKNLCSHGFKGDMNYKRHFKEYSKEEIRYMLIKCGFEIDKLPLKNFLVPIPYSIIAHYRNFRDTIIAVCKKKI